MRLLRSATRPQAVECFFCLSASLLPPRQTVDINGKGKGREISPVGTEWNWRCERCGCWNIRDQQGEMMSDLPAMHNPEAAVNRAAFSLRARPSSSHIPSGPSTSPFCRSCTSNQVLIMNMLANYLPEESDPTFGPLYDRLPDYLANLHHRYPPVCPACQPTVDAALKKADHRAQSEAWGFALKKGESSRRGGEGASSGPSRLAVMVWRLRGLLFCAGFVMSSTQGALATFQSRRLDRLGAEQRSNDSSLGWAPVCFHLLSIMWIAWDPYWLRVRRMGGQAKVTGRRVWVRNMLAILVIRLVSSSSALLESNTISRITQAGWGLEIALLLYSLLSIRIAQPVSLSLVRPTSTQSSSHPTPSRVLPSSTSAPVVDLSALSLNHHPLPNFQANPIFGQSSLQPLPNPAENDSMDWEPLPLTTKSTPDQWLDEADEGGGKADWNGFGIGKQRMFPQAHGTDETGLESLLAGWGLGGPQENASPSLRRNNSRSAVPQTSSGIARYHRAIGITLASLRFAGLAVMGLTSMSALNPNVKVFSSTTAHWTISALELANNVAKLIGDVPRLGLRDGKAGDIIAQGLAVAGRVLLAFGMPRLLEYVDITAINGDWRTYTIWILCGALTLGRS